MLLQILQYYSISESESRKQDHFDTLTGGTLLWDPDSTVTVLSSPP